jgi:hypothetical protein
MRYDTIWYNMARNTTHTTPDPWAALQTAAASPQLALGNPPPAGPPTNYWSWPRRRGFGLLLHPARTKENGMRTNHMDRVLKSKITHERRDPIRKRTKEYYNDIHTEFYLRVRQLQCVDENQHTDGNEQVHRRLRAKFLVCHRLTALGQ